MTIHGWDDRYRRGKEGERIVCSQLGFRPASEHDDRNRGIDAYGPDGRSYQIKTDDEAARTGNLFLESVSVEQHGVTVKRGGLATTEADIVLYYLAHLSEAWAFDPDELRRIVRNQETAGAHRGTSHNEDYNTRGYPIPLQQMKPRTIRIYSIAPPAATYTGPWYHAAERCMCGSRLCPNPYKPRLDLIP